MSAPPRLELIIPPVPPVPQEPKISSEGEPHADSPSSTLVSSTWNTLSSVDTLLAKFAQLENVVDRPVKPNRLSTLHLLTIHIGSGTFLLFLFSILKYPKGLHLLSFWPQPMP